MAPGFVVINDCVHGHIQLSRNLMRIVDTRQMQRLRDLKQLGFGSYVYPGATHTRFAHSIGACHLAGTFVRHLREQCAQLKPPIVITDPDIFCVEVAGLCHDLGHGPFSHMFEKAVHNGGHDKDWKHEQASLHLFDMMVEENKFKDDLFTEEEIEFIKELIHSEEEQRTAAQGKGKEFLYEIVDNQRTGLDVDKFDYFARDCQGLGLSNMFDHKRFILMARVLPCEDGKLHICHRDKELENLIIMFRTRFSLHMCAYKHPVVCALDRMVCDAFLHADKFLKVPGKKDQEGKRTLLPLTQSAQDPQAFICLSDSVLHRIRDYQPCESDDKDSVVAAQNLIERIEKRKLYKLVHTIKNFTDTTKKDELIKEEIGEIGEGKFDTKDVYIQIPEFGFGMKEINPLEKLHLYSKRNPDKAFPFNANMVSQLMMPKIFSERNVRVYYKAEDTQKIADVWAAAVKWEEQMTQAQSNHKSTQTGELQVKDMA